MLGLLKLLFKKQRYLIRCPNCGQDGSMYTKGGTVEGIFEVIGKTENASLHIKECPNCKNSLQYDSLSGKISIYPR